MLAAEANTSMSGDTFVNQLMSESGGSGSRRHCRAASGVRSQNQSKAAKIDSDVQVGADEGRKDESTAGRRDERGKSWQAGFEQIRRSQKSPRKQLTVLRGWFRVPASPGSDRKQETPKKQAGAAGSMSRGWGGRGAQRWVV